MSVPSRVNGSIADLKKRFDELELLSQNEPEMLHNVQEGKTGLERVSESIKKMKRDLLRSDSSEIPVILHDASLNTELSLQKLMNLGVFDWATKNQIEREVLRKELWEQIRLVLECGLALSLGLATAGCFFLSKQIVRRTSRLTENAVLMGQGKPLLPLLDGTDELAELDRNFHQAANLLEAAKRTRQEVTAMITHDLRTPLQTVQGFLEMLGQGVFGELNALGERLLSVTTGACHHMSKLIDNVLQLEKLRSGTVKLQTLPVEPQPFLGKCIAAVQLLAEEKDIKMTLQVLEEHPGTISIDAFWMEQVIVNILSNAIKFSPRGTSVTLTTSREKDNLTIRISDQGPGIPPDQQKLIFERFHRTKSTEAVPGTGLGLAIAKELVELHGGTISVESVEGQGATFVLRIPQKTLSTNVRSGTSKQESATSKKPALKLLHKGLILISIPLCFEITIFGLLLGLQNDVEKEANRIDHNRQVNDSVNLILHDFMHVGLGLRRRQRKTESNQTSTNQFRSLYADILKNFKQLEELVENEDLGNQIKRGERGVKLLAERLESQSKDTAEQEQVISDMLSMMNYLAKRSAEAEYDLHGSELRERSRTLLELAILFSIMFSCLGAAWYSRQIVNRLKRLSENSRLIVDGKPLLAPVDGTDEIAELDRSFHEAAAQIETAKKIRQEATVMITHDLKTPLQSLRNFLEMLGDDMLGKISEDGTKLRVSSNTSIQRMEELINSVLQLEKLRTGSLKLQTKPLLITNVLDKSLTSVKLLADQKSISISCRYNNLEDQDIEGDAFWLEQVLVNLLSNAIKFSGQNSTITITLALVENSLNISIADQGTGIPPQNVNQIFEKYFRPETVALVPGTGLGLPIAKELIELHGGSISVISTPGEGSTFTVTLPI